MKRNGVNGSNGANGEFHLSNPTLFTPSRRSRPPILLTDSEWSEQLAEIERAKAAIAERAFSRLVEIEAERDRILATFPELKKRAREQRAPGKSTSSQTEILYDADAHEAKPAKSKRGPLRKFDDAFKAHVVDRIKAGAYLVDLCKEHELHRSVVERWCSERGVKPPVMPPEEVQRRKTAGIRAAYGSDDKPGPAAAPPTNARLLAFERDITLPTLRYIAAQRQTDKHHLAKKFKLAISGAEYRIRALKGRDLVRSPGAGIIELTEAGEAMLAEAEQAE